MLKVAKKNAPIIIVYSNPKTLISFLRKYFFLKEKKIYIFIVILIIGGFNLKTLLM